VATAISDEELVDRFRGYGVDRDSAAHFRGRLERRFLVQRCDACGTWHHPPRPVCPACWSLRVTPTEICGRGSIFLAIFLHQGPPTSGVDYSAPYPVVTVELDEQPGLRVTSTIVDAPGEDIMIGRRVELDWIERDDTPLPVFRIAGDES
jgi:hypothetical protein